MSFELEQLREAAEKYTYHRIRIVQKLAEICGDGHATTRFES